MLEFKCEKCGNKVLVGDPVCLECKEIEKASTKVTTTVTHVNVENKVVKKNIFKTLSLYLIVLVIIVSQIIGLYVIYSVFELIITFSIVLNTENRVTRLILEL